MAIIGKDLLTVTLFEGTINTDVFTGWMTNDLLPKLPVQSVLIMDNAAFHKNKAMQKMIENAGHTLLYLPPYSPDLNPIEHKWAQAKALRKKLNCSISELFQYKHL